MRGVERLPIAEDPALDARLRQAVLAAIVVRDLDLVAADRGVEVADTGRLIPWRLVAALCRSRDPDQPATRAALGGWLAAVDGWPPGPPMTCWAAPGRSRCPAATCSTPVPPG